MIDRKLIVENLLQRTQCHKCGGRLDQARLVTVSEDMATWVAHAVCPVCKAESMITITPGGGGIAPVYSDLKVSERRKFATAAPINYDDLLDLHQALKKEKIWNLLDKKDKNLEKKRKA